MSFQQKSLLNIALKRPKTGLRQKRTMSVSSPSNDISAKSAAPNSSSVTSVSGAESTAAAVAMLLQAQSETCSPQVNSNTTISSHRVSPPSPSSMAVDCTAGSNVAHSGIPNEAAPQDSTASSILQDLALQQHMLQVKQQQMIQRQILEQQFQRNREMLQVEHERQLSLLLHQVSESYKIIPKRNNLVAY